MKRSTPAGSFLIALAMAGLCSHAAAQTTLTSPPATEEVLTLEPVVVTARHRTERLQDVPISISVMSRETAENVHASTLEDLAPLIPNFTFDRGTRIDKIGVRGVGGGGRNIGFDTRVGVYLDGVYVGQAQALMLPLTDIEQVEVLRGPQGYLYGRNTVAGAVNITTREPSATPESTVRFGPGNYGDLEAEGSFSGPLGGGVLGKLTIKHEQRDGYTTNLAGDGRIDGLDHTGLRGQLLFKPTAQIKVRLSGDYTRIKDSASIGEAITGLFGSPLTGIPLDASGQIPERTVSYNTPPVDNHTLKGASLQVDDDLGDRGTLTAITGYRDTRQHQENDTDYSKLDIFKTLFTDHFTQLSQEVRFASPVKAALRYTAGVYALDEDGYTDRAGYGGADLNAGPIPIGLIFHVSPGQIGRNSGSVKTKAYALFGSLDYDLTPAITLNLGTRQSYETKAMRYNMDGSNTGPLIALGNATNYTDRRTDNKFTPMAGLTFHLGRDLSAYVKYVTSYKAGGWNVDFLNQAQLDAGIRFNPETAGNLEAGVKGTAWGQRVQYDVAAFQTEYRDYQVSQYTVVGSGGNIVFAVRNAAKVESTGMEASMRARVADHLTLGASLGLLNADYKSFPGAFKGGDAAGYQLVDAPRTSGAITANYARDLPSLGGRLALYADCSFRGKSYTDVSTYQPIDRNAVVNTRLSYLSIRGQWTLSVWVRNLTNEFYSTSRGTDLFGNQFIRHGEPRMFGADLQYNF